MLESFDPLVGKSTKEQMKDSAVTPEKGRSGVQQKTRGGRTRSLSRKGLEEETKADLITHSESEIQKGYGSRAEPIAIKHYEAKKDVVVKNNNVQFHKKNIGTTSSGLEILVGGRIDGEVGKRVVEVKNRMKRFMNPLPAYDVAQLQTYLYLLDSPEGELV